MELAAAFVQYIQPGLQPCEGARGGAAQVLTASGLEKVIDLFGNRFDVRDFCHEHGPRQDAHGVAFEVVGELRLEGPCVLTPDDVGTELLGFERAHEKEGIGDIGDQSHHIRL